MIGFAIVGFASNLKDPKRRRSSLTGLVSFIAIVVLLVITYAIGSTDPVSLSIDFQKYNTDFYLKFADMWLYSIYVVLCINIVALIVFAIKGALRSKEVRSNT